MARQRLRSEQIYEAMVDDEAFARLPTLLARSVGARSCVIHWRDMRQGAEIMAHSPYFSAEQMLNYAENFVAHDQWSNIGQEEPFLNRVCNTKVILPAADYERSIFYNEWIRAMGDDTFHCIGTVMETDRGLGLIGLHRGKGQPDFDEEAIRELDRYMVHLRRMLAVRARLAGREAQVRGLTALLDANPAPLIAVTGQGRIVHANAAGEALFAAGALRRASDGAVCASRPPCSNALSRAIAQAADPAAPQASALVIRTPGGGVQELTVAPVPDRGVGMVLLSAREPGREVRLALEPVDPRDTLGPRELAIARLVAQGLRNREIAERLGLTEGTVKIYLNALFAKVGVKTRTELAVKAGVAR